VIRVELKLMHRKTKERNFNALSWQAYFIINSTPLTIYSPSTPPPNHSDEVLRAERSASMISNLTGV
jgi:hypothetical protein